MRAVLGQAFTNIEYTIGSEHGGGLPDDRKPGDIIVYIWLEGEYLLINVSVTNSLPTTYHQHLQAGGPGRRTKYREDQKRTKYRNLDWTKYWTLRPENNQCIWTRSCTPLQALPEDKGHEML